MAVSAPTVAWAAVSSLMVLAVAVARGSCCRRTSPSRGGECPYCRPSSSKFARYARLVPAAPALSEAVHRPRVLHRLALGRQPAMASCQDPMTMKIPGKLRRLAAEQDGLVTRQQALACGLSESAIRHALGRNGAWQKVVVAVYATFTGPLQERHRVRAALLHAGPQAVVTGGYACRAYGMKYAPASAAIEILVPQAVQRSPIEGVRIRRVTSLPVARTVAGIPLAPPERAALDAARGAGSRRAVRAVLCEVVQRRLTTVERLIDEFTRVDRRHLAHARQTFEDIQAGCRSAPECELRDLILTSDVLPEPKWNAPLPDDETLIPDGYIEQARLVLELESMEWHQFGDAPEATERRRARYASLGWRVYPVSPRRLREEPSLVLAEIETAAIARPGRAA
jgi:hypothetical protein